VVPKLRFKEFCGEWEEKRLGDIAEIYIEKEDYNTAINYEFILIISIQGGKVYVIKIS